MALTDFNNGNDGIYKWYNAAYGQINDYSSITSENF